MLGKVGVDFDVLAIILRLKTAVYGILLCKSDLAIVMPDLSLVSDFDIRVCIKTSVCNELGNNRIFTLV